MPPFVDIHCHLLPGLDDGADSLATSLEMARMAAAEGTRTIVATPHQLGAFGQNRGDDIRLAIARLQRQLDAAAIPITVLAGADVRIEDGLVDKLLSGEVLSLGDHRKHVLLELPHDVGFPLDTLLATLARRGIAAILSHPERNSALVRQPRLIAELVDDGCLMQVTAGSVAGSFGPAAQRTAAWMIDKGLVHFIATDAHGVRARRPLMRRAYERVAQLADERTALDLCCAHPAAVAAGVAVPLGPREAASKRGGWRTWFTRQAA